MAVRTLSAELQEIAKRDLNEDPERLAQDLQHLRDWLSKQPHLNARTDDQWLTTFLRGCKFSLERTKSRLDMYYTLRSALPEFFSNRDPKSPEIQHLINLGLILPLRDPDDQGRRVILMRNGLFDPNKVKIADVMKSNYMFMEVILADDDRVTVCGSVSIMDNTKNTLAHMTNVTPSLMKKSTTIFQEAYPFRPKAMHVIHMNSAFATIFNMFKSFMKEKLRNRMFIHANEEDMYQHVPKRILPTEYGGDAGPVADIIAEWKKKLEDKREWFLEDEKYKCDEKKRPGKPKTHEDLFGMEGSFRQLNVD